jgi:oligopeptide/dipeptide ABC transporter ATP-binding protein
MSSGIELRDAVVRFPLESVIAARLQRREPLAVTALDGVDLVVGPGESLGIVGESGCGKSTLARVLVGLVPLTSGTLSINGDPVGATRSRPMRRHIQMVFQDPSSSLNPMRTVGQILSELLRAHELVPSGRVTARCHELLELVHLPRSVLDVKPRQLSGGQRQRVGIARALALEPEVLIADEAVAALDVSVQATILNLLSDLRERLGLTLIFISHDLSVVRHISDQLAVMYLGRVVEQGSADAIFSEPRHPYTRALIAASPQRSALHSNSGSALLGEPPSPIHLPRGCRFAPRCPMRQRRCDQEDPQLAGQPDHRAACFFQDLVAAGARPESASSHQPTHAPSPERGSAAPQTNPSSVTRMT